MADIKQEESKNDEQKNDVEEEQKETEETEKKETVEDKEEAEIEDDHDSDEDRRIENLMKLGQYVNQMVYRLPSKEIETCCHVNRIAKKKPRVIADVYDEFHDVLSPRERSLRLKNEVERYKAITTEQLEAELKSYAAKEEQKMKSVKNKRHKRAQLLKKCEKACSDKILHKIVERFAAYVADRCENYQPPSVETENFQKMQQMLMCNLYLNLGDNKNKISPDQNIARMITVILADLIMQILFLTQNSHKYEEGEVCEPFLFESSVEPTCQVVRSTLDTSDLMKCIRCIENKQ
ncbi:hypothetical protein ACFFRR_005115 [Megaselia abdita]